MTSVLSLAILTVLIRFDVMTPAAANVIAAIAGIGPQFALNRRWVWKGVGRGHWRRELTPFWGYSLLSLVLSTVAVARAGHWADSIGASPEQRTMIILAADILTYGTLWMGQFLLLDKVLFRRYHHHGSAHLAAAAVGSVRDTRSTAVRTDKRTSVPSSAWVAV
jgi:putative flippase GtrA